jgi:hypothetical protein
MTAFNWAGLAARIRDMQSYNQAADYLRTRIEAAFVPVDQHRAICIGYSLDVEESTARAEAAEARVEVLEEALRAIDRKNDNPACFNADINDIVMAALASKALGGEHE